MASVTDSTGEAFDVISCTSNNNQAFIQAVLLKSVFELRLSFQLLKNASGTLEVK